MSAWERPRRLSGLGGGEALAASEVVGEGLAAAIGGEELRLAGGGGGADPEEVGHAGGVALDGLRHGRARDEVVQLARVISISTLTIGGHRSSPAIQPRRTDGARRPPRRRVGPGGGLRLAAVEVDQDRVDLVEGHSAGVDIGREAVLGLGGGQGGEFEGGLDAIVDQRLEGRAEARGVGQ